MSAFVVASPTGSYFVLNPARAALDRWDQMLGGGRVEAIVELHRTPDAEAAITLEDGLHALSSVHLTGFLAVHSRVKGTGTRVMWGLGF